MHNVISSRSIRLYVIETEALVLDARSKSPSMSRPFFRIEVLRKRRQHRQQSVTYQHILGVFAMVAVIAFGVLFLGASFPTDITKMAVVVLVIEVVAVLFLWQKYEDHRQSGKRFRLIRKIRQDAERAYSFKNDTDVFGALLTQVQMMMTCTLKNKKGTPLFSVSQKYAIATACISFAYTRRHSAPHYLEQLCGYKSFVIFLEKQLETNISFRVSPEITNYLQKVRSSVTVPSVQSDTVRDPVLQEV